jgi:hypothetical protein
MWLALAVFIETAGQTQAATGKVIKVLPQFLDLKGHNSLSPSLYERDAYQVLLRDHPKQRLTMCFVVQWKTKGAVKAPLAVRLELRGVAEGNLPRELVVDAPAERRGWFGHWTTVTLSTDQYKALGQVTAWRATLWEGDRVLGEQRSFLW